MDPCAKKRRMEDGRADVGGFVVYARMHGQEESVDCMADWTVGHLKAAIASVLGISVDASGLELHVEGEVLGLVDGDDVPLATTACDAGCQVRVEVSDKVVANQELEGEGIVASADSLTEAVVRGDARAAALLLRAGINAGTVDRFGRPMLVVASRSESTELARLLLDSGADVHGECRGRREAALHEAAEYGSAAVVRLLLEHGADVDQRDAQGRTPLMRCSDVACIQMLLDAGASPRAVDNDGGNALMSYIMECGCGDVDASPVALNLLINRTLPDLDAVDRTSKSALMHAAQGHQRLAVELLLAAGADPTLESLEGLSAWDFAHAADLTDAEPSGRGGRAIGNRAALSRALRDAEEAHRHAKSVP
eukprot:TRINITY_DN25004_c0_g1_i1.p1 TRINITY_DN25004_c0_g1~~TRINITY_DN25004_c0_g1_i1.p1  ORF type:complete len:367 (+),score=30.93 TRINITY_DN25004_c0_g1_i1:46-1146(+)